MCSSDLVVPSVAPSAASATRRLLHYLCCTIRHTVSGTIRRLLRIITYISSYAIHGTISARFDVYTRNRPWLDNLRWQPYRQFYIDARHRWALYPATGLNHCCFSYIIRLTVHPPRHHRRHHLYRLPSVGYTASVSCTGGRVESCAISCAVSRDTSCVLRCPSATLVAAPSVMPMGGQWRGDHWLHYQGAVNYTIDCAVSEWPTAARSIATVSV